MSDKASLADRVTAAEEENQKLKDQGDRLQRSVMELAARQNDQRDELDAAARLIESMAALYRKSRGYSANERTARSMRKSAEVGRSFSIETWALTTPGFEGDPE